MDGAIYDIAMAPLEWLILRRWRKELAASAAGDVLEIGAGTGRNLVHYQSARTLVLTDPDPHMLRRATSRLQERTSLTALVQADGAALPFGAQQFDTVVLSLTLCTAQRPEAVLREIARVLKPYGVLRLLEHVRAPGRAASRLQDALTPAWSRVGGGCHLNRATLDLARREGFEVLQTHQAFKGWLQLAHLRLRRP